MWIDPTVALPADRLAVLIGLALLAGNAVLWTPAVMADLPQRRPFRDSPLAAHCLPHAKAHREMMTNEQLDVLVLPDAASAPLRWTSERNGALPMVLCHFDVSTAARAFTWEKTVTINTAAVGGNLSLLGGIP